MYMKRMSFSLLITIIMVFTYSCNRKRDAITENLITYQVKASDDSHFQWNEFVDKVEFIQLETNMQSIIGEFETGVVDKDGIFILHWSNLALPTFSAKLLNFDLTGKFIREIGQQGRGPGEFLEMRDFCIVNNQVYTLDYQKIHCYNKNTGGYIDSWSIKDETGFNPANFAVFDRDNYYLWATNPAEQGESEEQYYHLRGMRSGEILSYYFEYKSSTTSNQRFFPCGDDSFNIRPIDGEDIIYKLTKDSLQASFFIDFGNMALSAERVKELKNSGERNAFYKSNAFKNIRNILELKDYIYFECVGPESFGYEGLVNKQTGEVKFGRNRYGISPKLFYSDGRKILYGYYDPSFITNMQAGDNLMEKCFNDVRSLKVDESDNLIIVKIHMK